MQILVTIGSGVFEGAGVEFPTFPLTYAVALKTLWPKIYMASEASLAICIFALALLCQSVIFAEVTENERIIHRHLHPLYDASECQSMISI